VWQDEERKVKNMAKKWIAGAIEHKGALHRALGVPEGEKIPASKMASASKKAKKSGGKLAKMLNLARTLKGFHK
jgi:hypothetical protein